MKIGDFVEFQAAGPNSKAGKGWIASFQPDGYVRIRLRGGTTYRHCHQDFCRVLPQRIVRMPYADD